MRPEVRGVKETEGFGEESGKILPRAVISLVRPGVRGVKETQRLGEGGGKILPRAVISVVRGVKETRGLWERSGKILPRVMITQGLKEGVGDGSIVLSFCFEISNLVF